ncbi:MAG TPA: four helix bundle protein [Acidimicrobiia bacterium]|nr:four helix bundle protein [Acidimicrobiia bacterium]
MQDFKRLRVWDESLRLAAEVYLTSAALPREERFALSSQMRRAVLSISSNIAEGAARESEADQARFLQIAIGSSSELESQIRVAQHIGLLDGLDQLLDHVDKVRRQLIRLQRRVKSSTRT